MRYSGSGMLFYNKKNTSITTWYNIDELEMKEASHKSLCIV